MSNKMHKIGMGIFDPSVHQEQTLDTFKAYIDRFGYLYTSLNRDPPASKKTDGEIQNWKQVDKKNYFLGRCCHMNLLKMYEDMVPEEERENLTNDELVTRFTERFRKATNNTLSNYKFRSLKQLENEGFDPFCVRVQREAQAWNSNVILLNVLCPIF